jgi:hypothetical protein
LAHAVWPEACPRTPKHSTCCRNTDPPPPLTSICVKETSWLPTRSPLAIPEPEYVYMDGFLTCASQTPFGTPAKFINILGPCAWLRRQSREDQPSAGLAKSAASTARKRCLDAPTSRGHGGGASPCRGLCRVPWPAARYAAQNIVVNMTLEFSPSFLFFQHREWSLIALARAVAKLGTKRCVSARRLVTCSLFHNHPSMSQSIMDAAWGFSIASTSCGVPTFSGPCCARQASPAYLPPKHLGSSQPSIFDPDKRGGLHYIYDYELCDRKLGYHQSGAFGGCRSAAPNG